MPVNYSPPNDDDLLPVAGITLGATAAKIKNWDRDDVLLVVAEPDSVASGVFTQNRFCAAPVIVCRDDVGAAAERISGLVERTPLIESEVEGVRIWLKCECLQTGGAFKLRGATNRLLQLSPEERGKGVVA